MFRKGDKVLFYTNTIREALSERMTFAEIWMKWSNPSEIIWRSRPEKKQLQKYWGRNELGMLKEQEWRPMWLEKRNGRWGHRGSHGSDYKGTVDPGKDWILFTVWWEIRREFSWNIAPQTKDCKQTCNLRILLE